MSAASQSTLPRRLSRWLQAQWWRAEPGPAARALQPVSWLYRLLAAWDRQRRSPAQARAALLPVPVVVVGNLIVGGAGKTPTTMALVHHLQQQGWHPGIVSRGFGRLAAGPVLVTADTPAAICGDEPLLMHLRTRAPVAVASNRLEAARRLLEAHPEVDVVISDDGLQHWPLPRDVQVLVFDGRGVGNGLQLPAGPLREAMPTSTSVAQLVLYNADQPSTALPGALAKRRLGGVLPLADWWQGRPPRADQLAKLAATSQHKPLLAAAGMADPSRFFAMLEAAGCRITRMPLPDHASFDPLPWPAGTPDVLVTEKDAVKLPPALAGTSRIWVVTLDFELPLPFTSALDSLLRKACTQTP